MVYVIMDFIKRIRMFFLEKYNYQLSFQWYKTSPWKCITWYRENSLDSNLRKTATTTTYHSQHVTFMCKPCNKINSLYQYHINNGNSTTNIYICTYSRSETTNRQNYLLFCSRNFIINIETCIMQTHWEQNTIQCSDFLG